MVELQEEMKKVLKDIEKKMGADDFAKIRDGLTRHIEKGEPAWKAFGIAKSMIEELYLIAYNQYNGGKYAEAKKLFLLLEFLDGTDIRFRYSVAACYQMEKKYWEAILKYTECLAIFEPSPLIFYHLADCYMHENEPRQAAAMLQGCLRTIGNNRTYDPLKFRAEKLYSTIVEQTNKEMEKGGVP